MSSKKEPKVSDIIESIKAIKSQESELVKKRFLLQEALREHSPLKPGDKVVHRGKQGFIYSINVTISAESNFVYCILKMKKDGTPSKQYMTWWATELNTKLYEDVQ